MEASSVQQIVSLYNDGWTSQQIAGELDFTSSGVRGMLSRARKQGLVGDAPGQETVYQPPSVKRQMGVVDRATNRFEDIMKRLRKQDIASFMFISDVHLPLEDKRCISLISQLLAAFQPNIATAMNDWFDFTEYSRWEDYRPPWAGLWTGDIQNALDYSAAIRSEWTQQSPMTQWPAVNGNHDNWLWRYLYKYYSGGSEYLLAQVMEALESQEVLLLANGSQNTVQLSPALKLTHGTKASSNRGTVAKSILKAHRDKSYEYGNTSYNVVYGHDHREVVFHDDGGGVTAYGAGCNCIPDPPYMSDMPDWDQGVVAGYFDPNGNYVQADLISFRPNQRGQLETFFQGRRYTSSV